MPDTSIEMGSEVNTEATNQRHVEGLIRRGVGWKAFSQASGQLSRIVIGVLLARLLTPADYGLAGMTLVFAAYVLVFADLGLGAALVQRQRLMKGDRSTAFWTSVASGALFTVLGVALAWPASKFFSEPDLMPLFAVMSTTFLITSLGATHKALLERSLAFRSLEIRTIAATILGGIIGIVFALVGFGAWAIVAQYLTWALVSTVLVWVAERWRPQAQFSRASLHRLLGFGGSVLGNRFVYVTGDVATNALIGRFVGASGLGVYTVANNLVLTPLSRLSIPVAEVFFPGFSRMQDDRERIASIWLQSLPYLAGVSLPALVGLIVVAPDFVVTVLGEQWLPAVPVIQILTWVGIIRSLHAWNSSILLAIDRAKTLLYLSIGSLVVTLFGVLVGVGVGGVVAVAAGVAVAQSGFSILYLVVVTRELGITVRSVLRVLVRPTVAACAMGVVVWIGREALGSADAGSAAKLLFSVAIGVLSYVLSIRIFCPAISHRVAEVARARLAGRID